MKKILCLVVLGSVFSGVTFAQTKTKPVQSPSQGLKTQNTSAYRYGMAGCGIGSIVFTKPADNVVGMQIIAAILNATVSSQTWGVSSGTSNCGGTPQDVATSEQKTYLEANFATLSKEAAQGEGEQLRSLAEVFGCQGNSVQDFLNLSQNKYSLIFASNDSESAHSSYVSEMKANPVFKEQCERLYF
jgi:Protein of unknown function (DUF3015)